MCKNRLKFLVDLINQQRLNNKPEKTSTNAIRYSKAYPIQNMS